MGRTFTVIGTHALIQIITWGIGVECSKSHPQVIAHRSRCRTSPRPIKSTPQQRCI
jgi:hypothetical protein